jgi:glycosyltransferase involved in cell wall biosynthesis
MAVDPLPRYPVSLVVTTLNEAESLPALLDSIVAQTRQPDEVVVVDGGSRDGTWEMLQAWASRRPKAVILRAPGANIATGRNLAIARACGEIIAATDAGVTLDARWLELLVDPLEKDPDLDVASGFFLAAPTSTFELALGATVLPHRTDVDPARFLPSSRSIAFRRTAWEQVGRYPEWLDYCEDLVFDLALREAGFRFTWVPGALVFFRPRPTLAAFFTQYFRYARGDGKADLWRGRHMIRFGTYCIGLPLLWRWRRHPPLCAAGLAAALLYVHRPMQRLLAMTSTEHHTCGPQEPAQPVDRCLARASTLVRGLALVPLIRFVGDLAKMLGYPVGVAWRLCHRAELST